MTTRTTRTASAAVMRSRAARKPPAGDDERWGDSRASPEDSATTQGPVTRNGVRCTIGGLSQRQYFRHVTPPSLAPRIAFGHCCRLSRVSLLSLLPAPPNPSPEERVAGHRWISQGKVLGKRALASFGNSEASGGPPLWQKARRTSSTRENYVRVLQVRFPATCSAHVPRWSSRSLTNRQADGPL